MGVLGGAGGLGVRDGVICNVVMGLGLRIVIAYIVRGGVGRHLSSSVPSKCNPATATPLPHWLVHQWRAALQVFPCWLYDVRLVLCLCGGNPVWSARLP